MKLTFYGGAREVGRSCVLFEDKGKEMLLDCGIKLGERIEYPILDEADIKRIEHVFISHAHLDHCGYLPHLFARGSRPKVFLTKPTRDIMAVLLADYLKIHRERAFSQRDIECMLKATQIMELGQSDSFTLYNAGHIMGSTMIKLNVDGGLLYTGDICTRKTRILDGCEKNLAATTLVIETTYGGKNDIIPSAKDAAQKLVNIINSTLDKGGWVLIPSFAVGRAQELLLLLDDYMRSGVLQLSRIFIDGMIGKIMRIYRHNAIYANDDIKRRILMSEDNPFKSKFFHVPRSKTREDVLKEPSIIVSTSGMLSGGPALFYLEKLAANPANTIIFVGYQAPGTLGSKIAAGEKRVVVGEKEIEIKMAVENVKLSGHADYNELLQFIKNVKGLKRVFLMHGEKAELKDALEKDYEVVVPRLGESFSF